MVVNSKVRSHNKSVWIFGTVNKEYRGYENPLHCTLNLI